MVSCTHCNCYGLILCAIQGSSVPCERALSDAGLTDAKRCVRLLPKHLGDIQTLKSSFKVRVQQKLQASLCVRVQVQPRGARTGPEPNHDNFRWRSGRREECQRKRSSTSLKMVQAKNSTSHAH
ncbi:hypothetical protein AZE42_07167 [Rhizopogon vesiculosus]|uniref:Uncharacterized protein n=1 Tax=Rhizopogon vesiculosus TaxID=180088 RepID=A0A1J8PQ97_9AGAM|nr:hypothetical protein AZE42_07167 [Rhizopogon vesiculosus]